MNLGKRDLATLLQLVLWEEEYAPSATWRPEYLDDLATRLQAELSKQTSRSTERRLDVQRDAMSDFDRDKIGYEDNDGTLGLRDRRG